MITDFSLVRKVLNYIKDHHTVRLDTHIMKSQAGFTKLAKEGLIEIHEIDGGYFACLTDEGLELINEG